jgi:hypothetical protein
MTTRGNTVMGNAENNPDQVDPTDLAASVIIRTIEAEKSARTSKVVDDNLTFCTTFTFLIFLNRYQKNRIEHIEMKAATNLFI